METINEIVNAIILTARSMIVSHITDEGLTVIDVESNADLLITKRPTGSYEVAVTYRNHVMINGTEFPPPVFVTVRNVDRHALSDVMEKLVM